MRISIGVFIHTLHVRSRNHIGQLTSLCLQVRVTANVLLLDEDVRHTSLTGHFLERILKSCTIVCDWISTERISSS